MNKINEKQNASDCTPKGFVSIKGLTLIRTFVNKLFTLMFGTSNQNIALFIKLI
jgi:hypothetical protein